MKELRLVAKGSAFSFMGDATNYFLSYVFVFIASHLLGASYLGAFYWALSISSLLGEFADCGTGQGLIYFGPRFEAEKGENRSLSLFRFVLFFTLRNAILLGLLLFIAAPFVAGFFNKPELTWLLRAFSIALPLGLFWPVAYKYFVARFKIVEGILYGDILRPVLRVSFLLLFVFLGLKSFALVGTEIFVGASLMAVGLVLIFKLWGKDFVAGKLTFPEKRSLLAYSIPFVPLNMARGERVTIIIVSYFMAVAQIGVFGVVLKVAALSQVILTGMNFVFRPMVSKLYAEKNMKTLNSIYKSITRWTFILTIPLSYLFIFYPASILSLFGNNFSPGATALTIISLGFLFEYGTSATQVIINMTGRSWLSLLNQAVFFAVIAVFGIWLIPVYGMLGAAIAVSLAFVAINIVRLVQAYKIVGFTPYSLYLFKPVIAAITGGIVLSFVFPIGIVLPLIKLLMLVLGFLVIYVLMLLFLKIDPEDWKLLIAAKRKLIRHSSIT
ncbi:MAG: polysaccharide biosynthesis C-terminal domain-containing protein [Candidatus Margulisiibacteriota bacterium]|nr:oligosaccharide flippase family protein [Candidatus Margulisiibacteriota bacterium]